MSFACAWWISRFVVSVECVLVVCREIDEEREEGDLKGRELSCFYWETVGLKCKLIRLRER